MNIIEANRNEIDAGNEFKIQPEQPIFNLNKFVSKFERLWFYLTIVLTGMLVILFILFYMIGNQIAETEKNYQRELRIQQMQNTLSTALIDAQKSDFEAARQTANDFFVSLENELISEKESVFTENQRQTMRDAAKKKAIINKFLAEKNPQAGDELAKVLETYQKTTKGFQTRQKQGG